MVLHTWVPGTGQHASSSQLARSPLAFPSGCLFAERPMRRIGCMLIRKRAVGPTLTAPRWAQGEPNFEAKQARNGRRENIVCRVRFSPAEGLSQTRMPIRSGG